MESSSGQHNIPAADIGAGGTRMSFRDELDSKRYSVVDEDWAGGVPAQYGVAPRIRIGRDKWFNLLWLIPIGLLLLIVGIAVAKGLRELPAIQDFMQQFPGTSKLPDGAPVGFPAWLGWQHFLNAFLMIFIIRSGITIMADHPTGPGTPPRARTGSGCKSRCPATRCTRQKQTRSRCRTASDCRDVATPSVWPGGGTWAWTRCGCSTASCSSS